MTTMQQMIDTAIDEGAATVALWTVDGIGPCMVKVTDNGAWYFVDTADRAIDEADARRLLDCFQIGYID